MTQPAFAETTCVDHVSPVAFAVLVSRVENLERNYYEIKNAMARIEEKVGKVVLFVALLAGGAGAGASQLFKILLGG